MNGFGKDLKETTKRTRLFRKVSFDNYTNSGEICCSTSDSVSLIGRGDFCLVFAEKEYTGLFVDGDADAGKNYGYDEFRVNIENISEAIEAIVVPDWWIEAINDENFDGEDDPYEWVENIMTSLNIYMSEISATEAKEKYNIDFNF